MTFVLVRVIIINCDEFNDEFKIIMTIAVFANRCFFFIVIVSIRTVMKIFDDKYLNNMKLSLLSN